MPISKISNHDLLARFLAKDFVVNAYSLGYLDERYSDEVCCFGELVEGDVRAAALVYTGLSRPGLFTHGNVENLIDVLRAFGSELPGRVTAHFPTDHRASVEGVFEAGEPLRRMHRMGLTAAEFQDPGDRGVQVDVLSHRDTAGILQLYRHWRDNFFEPYQLESGLYFGVREGGELVSIAGVHNVSEKFDIAAIGNLVTHPDHRGKGYAIACTAALLRAVFERVGNVTLDVQENNEPAKRTYERFGFVRRGDFFEAAMQRRG